MSIWIFEIFAMFWAGILIFLDFFLTKYIIIFMVFLTDVLGYYYFFTMLYFYIKVNNQFTLFVFLFFQFPYCDGSHNEHNKETGDNVGPIIVKRANPSSWKRFLCALQNVIFCAQPASSLK